MGWFHPSAFPSPIFNNKHLLPKMLTFMTTVLQKPVQSYTLLAQRFTASGPHLMLSVADPHLNLTPEPSWDSSRCWSSSRVCFLHGFGAERIYISTVEVTRISSDYLREFIFSLVQFFKSKLTEELDPSYFRSLKHLNSLSGYTFKKQATADKYGNIRVNENSVCGLCGTSNRNLLRSPNS